MAIILTSFLIGSWILATSYTAMMVSLQTVHVTRYIRTLPELADHPEYDLIVLRDSLVPSVLQVDDGAIVFQIS